MLASRLFMEDLARFHAVVDRFFDDARALRAVLKRRLEGVRDPFASDRFAWESWHVPGQFSQLRTPARSFFPAALVDSFEARLLSWAGRQWGLSSFGGPPWLSILVDGHYQQLHRDSPNGELAFSFGLSWPPSPRFRGGETCLARPELLDYFRRGCHRAARADEPLFDEIESRFNRLVAFDSRLPHAVRMVEGPRRPLDGRIAVQGWLRAAGCVVDAGVDEVIVRGELSRVLSARTAAEFRAKGVEGLLAVRLEVGRKGSVTATRIVADTLVATDGIADGLEKVRSLVPDRLRRARLPGGRAHRVVAPVLFGEDGVAHIPRAAGV